MKIEMVTVCKDYSDFLTYTLPENLQHCDRMVVVSHPDDKATKNLCDKYGVDCFQTKVFHDDGDDFNKWRAINLGLSHLKHVDWILHLDADILLPHRFREMVKKAKLNPKHLYGADRLNTKSFDHWNMHQHHSYPQFQWRYLIHPNPHFELGSRLLHNEYGWCPIGYFQMWHSSLKRQYPITHGSAEHGDVLFAVQWPREERILLPEFFVYHLESEQAPMGKNWNGRKTKPFGPTVPCHPPKPYVHGCKK